MKKTLTAIVTLIFTICSFPFTADAALIAGDDGFYFTVYADGTAAVAEYHGSSAEITIPSEFNKCRVAAVADKVFLNNSTVKSVVIPETVTAIGAYAFSGCTNLEAVSIPDSVTAIKAATFYGCTNLRKVEIPASVTRIAPNAFVGSSAVIVGEKGSYAESFASENGIPFRESGEPLPATDTDTGTDSTPPDTIDSEITTPDTDTSNDTDTGTDSTPPDTTDSEITAPDTDTNNHTDTGTDSDHAPAAQTDTPGSDTEDAGTGETPVHDVVVDTDYVTSDNDFETDSDETPDTPVRPIVGDADLDGSVTSADALIVLRISIGLDADINVPEAVIDVDKDGAVTSADALDILRFSVGIPVGEIAAAIKTD